jgi:uncharacterized tellurite resistance protein B-like protein
MLDRIRAFFREGHDQAGGAARDELQLAVAGLLVEAAHQDGRFGEDERKTIQALLQSRLNLAPGDTDALIEVAEERVGRSSDLWSFAQVVKNRYDAAERIRMLEMLWEVVYADGVLDDFEASLMRRIAGLLYVSDADSGAARKRVLDRLGLEG